MNTEQTRHALEIASAALAHDVEERQGFLDAACADDPQLRTEVERLLALGQQAEERKFLEEEPALTVKSFVTDSMIGQRIDSYRTVKLLGEGAMGEVYLADQLEPIRRSVALKLIKPGLDSRAVLARFEAEKQALALMDHPNVATVFDAGMTQQGRPYFVMEYVRGLPITDHCDQHRLDIEDRLELFMQVCDAVQHAHQKGVIHRDIKPSNILVAGGDGRSIPKVIDFGVAKAIDQRLTQETLFTEQGQLIGTPAYMSPEQAELSVHDVDTRTDIYSLGVLLYELLAGVPPFDPGSLRQAAFDEIRHIIRDVDPPKPSTKLSSLSVGSAVRTSYTEPPASAGADRERGKSARAKACGSVADIACNRQVDPRALTRRLRGDLDWITMKALEKERSRRYATASAAQKSSRS